MLRQRTGGGWWRGAAAAAAAAFFAVSAAPLLAAADDLSQFDGTYVVMTSGSFSNCRGCPSFDGGPSFYISIAGGVVTGDLTSGQPGSGSVSGSVTADGRISFHPAPGCDFSGSLSAGLGGGNWSCDGSGPPPAAVGSGSWSAQRQGGGPPPGPPSSTESATSEQSTTTATTSSAATTSTETCHVVNPSDHISMCVPSWLSGLSTGSAAITTPSGAQPFAGTLPPGDGLSTGTGSYAAVSDPEAQSTVSLAPDSSLASNFRGYLDPSSSEMFACENPPFNCQEAVSYNLSKQLFDALKSAFGGHTTVALYKMAHGELNAFADVLTAIPKVATCVAAPNALACDAAGSDVEATVGSNGTEFDVVSGSWVVINRASGQFVSLSAGQKVVVPGDATRAAAQNLKGSIASFDPAGVDRWWERIGSSSGRPWALIGAAGGGALALLAGGWLVALTRRRPPVGPLAWSYAGPDHDESSPRLSTVPGAVATSQRDERAPEAPSESSDPSGPAEPRSGSSHARRSEGETVRGDAGRRGGPRGRVFLGVAVVIVLGCGAGTVLGLRHAGLLLASPAPQPTTISPALQPSPLPPTPVPLTPVPPTPVPVALTPRDVCIGPTDLPSGYTRVNDSPALFGVNPGLSDYLSHAAPAGGGTPPGWDTLLAAPNGSPYKVFCGVVFYPTVADAQVDIAHRFAVFQQPRLGVRPQTRPVVGVGSDARASTLAVPASNSAPGVLGDGFSEGVIVWRVGSVYLELVVEWNHVGQATQDFDTTVTIAEAISSRAAQPHTSVPPSPTP